MITTNNISKSFYNGKIATTVLDKISLEIKEGEFISIIGRSGSGKSTLLNILATLIQPDTGNLYYQEHDLSQVKDAKLNRVRQTDFSMIFQFHHLLPYLTVQENTMLPFMNSLKTPNKSIRENALSCLKRVGLYDKRDRLPSNLSGGEQQRVAIARALVKSSKILFADEPTGSLDKHTGKEIMELISELHQEGLTVVMVTHDPEYAAMADRTIAIEDGRLIDH